ncbi:unnamed protein product [Angiostrongylus costaricensis]|uniref:Transcriptional regulator n=1 Tax=Angiostrongylus costaricensis TaxID=334426 RepID=A0A0R3Q1S6_ANGCS|nr:unnamed protein product [Angiostrongylus costaricensis]
MLDEFLERAGTTWLFLRATGKNRRFIGARSSHLTIKEQTMGITADVRGDDSGAGSVRATTGVRCLDL